jgi:hypothetical protein
MKTVSTNIISSRINIRAIDKESIVPALECVADVINQRILQGASEFRISLSDFKEGVDPDGNVAPSELYLRVIATRDQDDNQVVT